MKRAGVFRGMVSLYMLDDGHLLGSGYTAHHELPQAVVPKPTASRHSSRYTTSRASSGPASYVLFRTLEQRGGQSLARQAAADPESVVQSTLESHLTDTPSSADALIDQVRAAAEDDDQSRIVAILWTWLELHLLDLIEHQKKPPAIRTDATKGSFSGMNESEYEKLRGSPVLSAADLLARISFFMKGTNNRGFRIIQPSRGFDDSPVIVVWKTPALADMAARMETVSPAEAGDPGEATPPQKNDCRWGESHEDEVGESQSQESQSEESDDEGEFATSMEHPTLAALAPRLVVCPLEVNQIRLRAHHPESEMWDFAMNMLEHGLGREGLPSLTVHLDPLGTFGMSGWTEQQEPHIGWFDAKLIDKDDEARCTQAACQAVAEAAAGPSILVMPELAATPSVVQRIKETLKSRQSSGKQVPMLTVVGLYHELADEPGDATPVLVGDASLAGHVNEAVVLGPDGVELWRHRKLTCAQDRDKKLEPVVEDVRPGRTVTIVNTALGVAMVAICLDVIAERVRARIVLSGADLLLVPSLSPSVKRHRRSLEHLVHVLGAIAFVCNRGPLLNKACAVPDVPSEADIPPEASSGETDPSHEHLWNAHNSRSFWAIQKKEIIVPPLCKPGEHPSFVFCLNDHEYRSSTAQVCSITMESPSDES
jgi:predicted amidohydrolase